MKRCDEMKYDNVRDIKLSEQTWACEVDSFWKNSQELEFERK